MHNLGVNVRGGARNPPTVELEPKWLKSTLCYVILPNFSSDKNPKFALMGAVAPSGLPLAPPLVNMLQHFKISLRSGHIDFKVGPKSRGIARIFRWGQSPAVTRQVSKSGVYPQKIYTIFSRFGGQPPPAPSISTTA